MKVVRRSVPLLSSALLVATVLSQEVSDQSLPIVVWDEPGYAWGLTLPLEWDYKTVLSAIRTYNESQYSGYNISHNIADLPAVYVNGTLSVYATYAINYEITAIEASNNEQGLHKDISPSDMWAMPVVCEWGINGTYGRLNRILYYILLVFSLVVRHHEWLVAGALASATTYSGAAAVQTWAQFGFIHRYGDAGGDNDGHAIFGILAAGLLMAVPLINWSRTLRRLETRPLLIYWALIILSGYILILVGQMIDGADTLWKRHAKGIMTCAYQGAIPYFKNLGFIDSNFISKYHCDNPCYNAKSYNPFHSSDGLQPRLNCFEYYWTNNTGQGYDLCLLTCPRDIVDTDSCYIDHGGYTTKQERLETAGYYGILPVILLELFFVLLFGRMSPEEIRDWVFERVMSSKHMDKYKEYAKSTREGGRVRAEADLQKLLKKGQHRARIGFAQTVALVLYFFAVLTYLVCIPFFVFNIAWTEYTLRLYPEGEQMYEVGQWLPWVVVGLTLGAAIVGKYHRAWHKHAKYWLAKSSKLFKTKSKGGEGPIKPKTQKTRTVAANKRKKISSWFKHHTWRTQERFELEWSDLGKFWSSPIFAVVFPAEERTKDYPRLERTFLADITFPNSELRNSGDDDHYKLWKDIECKSHIPVAIELLADDHTLTSWERYNDVNKAPPQDDEARLVYTLDLKPVPYYPDVWSSKPKEKNWHREVFRVPGERMSDRELEDMDANSRRPTPANPHGSSSGGGGGAARGSASLASVRTDRRPPTLPPIERSPSIGSISTERSTSRTAYYDGSKMPAASVRPAGARTMSEDDIDSNRRPLLVSRSTFDISDSDVV